MRTANKPKEQQGSDNPAHQMTDVNKLNLQVKQIELQIMRLRELIKTYQMGC